MFYIYRITNLINGKTYIGQRKYSKLNDDYKGSGKRLWEAYRKYGFENFKKEILVFNISERKHADLLEKTFIAAEREKAGVENCYNISDGGTGGNLGEEVNKKISEALKGKHHKGYPHSEETKQKISEALKGRVPWNIGKHLSEETKQKIKKAKKGYHHSEETRKKISEANKGRLGTMLGKHHSEETRRKMSENHKGMEGKHFSEEAKKRMSESHKDIKQSIESREKRSRSVSEVLKVHRELYKHYKSTGGELNWNAFRKKMRMLMKVSSEVIERLKQICKTL